MAVLDQVQEVLGVGGGDVQRVHHVEEGLEESRESSVTNQRPLQGRCDAAGGGRFTWANLELRATLRPCTRTFIGSM